ncbi:MAG: hypothetical protein CME21_21835 [Gemmatimonadetes bacterium]|jgi:hypothetical protein|nr:hypothetical protein [Gemmatimonadota bacterium]
MSSQKSTTQSPRVLILIGLAAWIATFIALHGPKVILGYLALQVVTSGVFAYSMWKAEQQPASPGSTGEEAGESASPQ